MLVRRLILGAIVGLCLFGAGGSTAGAFEFIWKVNGAKLAAGGRELIKTRQVGNQVFKATVLGVATEITCEVAKTAASSVILGGIPGTSGEDLEYSKCTVQKPAGCKVKHEEIDLVLLTNEIVKGEGASAEKSLLVFRPEGGGKALGEIKQEGFFCPTFTVEGSVLAEVTPKEREQPTLRLKFEPAEAKSYENSKGEKKLAGMEVGGKVATLTGEVNFELPTSGFNFGVF